MGAFGWLAGRLRRQALASVDVAAGGQYVFDRWRELTAVDAPWWARPEGLGLRMRLKELTDVADAERGGGAKWANVSTLIADARLVFAGEDSYATSHLPEISKQIERLFKPEAPNLFGPSGRAYSLAQATVEQLDESDYRERLLEQLESAAAAAGWQQKRLAALDPLIELFDAELVGDGHAPAWRRATAERAESLWQAGGATVAEAISRALHEGGHSEGEREFTVVVPVRVDERPAGGPSALQLADYDPTEALILDWAVANAGALVADQLFSGSDEFYVDNIRAVDPHAGAALADERFRRGAGLWGLREGQITAGGSAFIYDPRLRQADVYRLPPEPLRLTPDGIESYDPLAEPKPPRLDDALAQLAQARTASPTTALVDIWTAVEALFGGTEADPSYDAGNTMAALGEFCFARESFLWLSKQLDGADYGNPPAGGEVPWVEHALLNDAQNISAVFRDNTHPLAWVRAQSIMRWEPGAGYRDQTTLLRERLQRVSHRAYLIRNSLVHAASLKTDTLGVTLPTFADLTRVGVGFVLRQADERGALMAAKKAVLTARWVADCWEKGTLDGAAGLRRLLL